MNRFIQFAFFALIVTLCQSQKIALKKLSTLQYYGQISLGTPAQTLKVMFDTNSNDAMILSDKNSVLPSATPYSSSSSSSYTAIGTGVSIIYPFGSVDGVLSQDLLKIAGYSIPNQVFIESTNTSNYFTNSPYQGIVGMGLDNKNGYSQPFTNLFSLKLISNNFFSFWLNKNSISLNEGELYLGGTNPTLYTGSLKYTPLAQKTSWTIKADSASISGLNYIANFNSLISTEHTLIYGDSKTIDKIITKLGVSYSSQYGYYYVSSSKIATMSSIDFKFNGNTFSLKPTDYVYDCKDNVCDLGACGTYCQVGFGKIDSSSTTWILGNIFMRAYYTVFDVTNSRIGFATAV